MWAASLLVLSAGTSALSAGLKPDLRYVSPPATDASSQISTPVAYPRALYPEIEPRESGTVSYTHLTLPTILLV